jgi:hypothetical protein
MKEPFYCYFIRSGWPERAEAASEIGTKFVKTLDVLSGIDSIFADWVLFDKLFDNLFDIRSVSVLSLANARSRISEIVENNVSRNESGKVSLVRGYHAIARAGKFRDPRSVSFEVTAGGQYENGAKLEFGDYDVAPDLDIIAYPLFKAALLAINAIWQAPWACAQAFRSGTVSMPANLGGVPGFRIDSVPQAPSDLSFPYSIFHIPWIAYLAPELTAGLKVRSEIVSEHSPDGGLLMSVTTGRFDPGNPEHMRGARILAEIMIERTGYQPGRPMYA